jgi:hypothetical protein
MKIFSAAAAVIVGAMAIWSGMSGVAAAPTTEAQWNMSGAAPHLVVHYMPWFSTPDTSVGPNETWTHWNWTGKNSVHDPNKILPDGRRDIASVCYPLIGPYNTNDRAVIRYHLATIKAAGIQGIFIDWDGPHSQIDRPISLIVNEASKVGLKVGICYEEKSNFVWPDFRNPQTRDQAVNFAVADLTYVLRSYAVSPAFMRRNGRPVIFQFNGYGTGSLGPKYFTPEEWDTIIGRLPVKIYYGRQGLDPAYSASAQFRYTWNPLTPGDGPGFASEAHQMIENGKASFFMSMVSPGFDDTGVWGWGGGPRICRRNGLAVLKQTMSLALADDPEIVQIVTWNDFNEGTVIEPTKNFGFADLDAIAEWWAQRAGKHANLAAIRAPFLEYVKTCTPDRRAELPAGDLKQYVSETKISRSIVPQE